MEWKAFSGDITARRFLDLWDYAEKEAKRRNKKPIWIADDGTRRTRMSGKE